MSNADTPAAASADILRLQREFWHTLDKFDPYRPLASALTRAEAGQELRRQVPREAHGDWQPAADRPDPIATLRRDNQGRQEELVPLRLGRMAASPFAFLRGAASVMAWDLSRTPISGLPVVMDGDAHINNFGLYGTPQRDVIIDLNDFDETTFGPWEWDLKRLAASVNVAARENGLNRRERRAAVLECVAGYSGNCRRLQAMGVLDVWSLFAHAEIERHTAELERRGIVISQKSRDIFRRVLDKARRTTNQTLLTKIARRQADGGWRFIENPPILTRIDDATREKISAAQVEYADSLPTETRFMLHRYSVADVVHRVVGVGSVGLRAYLVLLFGNGEEDPLFLQVKEAVVPAHAPYLPPRPFHTPHEGRRVVVGQRVLQALGDPLLGYTTIDGRHYFVRQMKNRKASVPIEEMRGEPFEFWVWMCGALLARAHARTGDPAKIAGYIGKSDALGQALAEFAERYGDQNERDHAALVAAINEGRVTAIADET
jgi:uncharacterized protein (DUF2252 family)